MEADSTLSLSGEEDPQADNESGPTNLLLPAVSFEQTPNSAVDTMPEGPTDSYADWPVSFNGDPDLSSRFSIYNPDRLSNWHPEYPQRKCKKSKKDRPKRGRINFLIEERNWIDQKYSCYTRLYPNLRINQIAKMIYDELYIIPLVEIGDSEVRSIRKLIKRFSSRSADRQYQSVLFHLYNIRKRK